MSLAVAGAALYGAGLAATLSPCVLPLVPGYLGVLADGDTGPPRVARVALFAGGVTAVFVLLGAGAGLLGAAGGSGLAVQRVAGVALITFALLGVLGRRGRIGFAARPASWLPSSPAWRAVVLGIGCGAAWSPCTGPLLGAALSAAGSTGSALRSSVLLAAFAAGVLTPFVALSAVGTARVPPWARRAGRVLGSVGTASMLVLGAVLALGWYDALVGRLPVPG